MGRNNPTFSPSSRAISMAFCVRRAALPKATTIKSASSHWIGQVGVGCSKAAEVIIAIQKAIADGRKNLINVPIFKTTIPHPIVGRSGAGCVMLRPASQGTGIIAGGAVRQVLELAGIENILCKSLGSKSPLNAANATLDALKSLRNFNDVAKKRGISLTNMLN